MKPSFSLGLRRGLLLGGAGLVFATAASAVRVGDASPPAASAVQSSPQQPAHVQADESASLRQGIIVAIDLRGGRILVHDVWLRVDADKTKLVRDGRPSPLDTLKAGEAIRFAFATDSSGNRNVRLIYAP